MLQTKPVLKVDNVRLLSRQKLGYLSSGTYLSAEL